VYVEAAPLASAPPAASCRWLPSSSLRRIGQGDGRRHRTPQADGGRRHRDGGPQCVAPLLAYLLDVPVARALPCVASGAFETMLGELFDAGHLETRPPIYVDTW